MRSYMNVYNSQYLLRVKTAGVKNHMSAWIKRVNRLIVAFFTYQLTGIENRVMHLIFK